jgi:uncharacterized protein (TIGR04255 family)
MLFPESDRVKYAKYPLVDVLCQLMFPTILRINADPPVAFQERIRHLYPYYQQRQVSQNLIPEGLAKIIPPDILQELGTSGPPIYDFASEDQAHIVTLTNEGISLTSRLYTRYADFRQRFLDVVVALQEVYNPHAYVRIGLRYRNLLIRSELEVEDVPWSELLQPYISGLLAAPNIGEFVTGTSEAALMTLPEGGQLRLQHGLVQLQSEQPEMAYLIDGDFYIRPENKTEVEDAFQILDKFNGEAARLLRWCISDRLATAMEPSLLPPRERPA